MHVAVVAPQHPLTPEKGGIARYLLDYVPALAERVRVSMLTIEDGPELPGVEQVMIDRGSLPNVLAAPGRSRRVVAQLQRLRPDVVEHANYMSLACRDPGPWARVMRMSSPISKGSAPVDLLRRLVRPLHYRWDRQAVRRMDYWISNTQANLETCRAVYGVRPPSTVIPHGLNLPRQSPDADAVDLLFVGTMESRKGLDVLVRAWARALNLQPDLPGCLHLVGKDSRAASGGSFLQEALAAVTLPEGRLNWYGVIDDAALAALRRRVRVCLVPSRYESFGLVVLEGFAAEQAVIASAAGGLVEVVDDGETGLLVPPEDVEALAQAIVSLQSDDALRARLVRGAVNILDRRFSMRAMVESSLLAYEDAIATVKRTRSG